MARVAVALGKNKLTVEALSAEEERIITEARAANPQPNFGIPLAKHVLSYIEGAQRRKI